MARSTRLLTLRWLDAAVGNLDTAQEHLAKAAQPFEEGHPKYFQRFCDLMAMLEQAKTPIKDFRDII